MISKDLLVTANSTKPSGNTGAFFKVAAFRRRSGRSVRAIRRLGVVALLERFGE